jgi:hypothetical protein
MQNTMPPWQIGESKEVMTTTNKNKQHGLVSRADVNAVTDL